MNFIPLAATDLCASLTSGTQRTSSSFSICSESDFIYTTIHHDVSIYTTILNWRGPQIDLSIDSKMILSSEKSMAGKIVRYSAMLLLLSQGCPPCF